jgi:hypothetical protein
LGRKNAECRHQGSRILDKRKADICTEGQQNIRMLGSAYIGHQDVIIMDRNTAGSRLSDRREIKQ